MEQNKKKKQNRVRLNQNPYIAQQTQDEIARRKKQMGLSLGRILDIAIRDTTPADIKEKQGQSCQ